MTDPYQVLGVSPSSSDEEIKNAYRNLARKYHPDHYTDNPLADLAQEKMKEINEAYDQIQKMRKGGSSQSSRASGSSGYGGGQGGFGGFNNYGGQQYQQNTSSAFGDIRRLINQRRFVEAEELLDGVPFQNRDAEWNFLKGSVCYSKGWLDQAHEFFAQAVRMNPAHPEYTAAYQQLNRMRTTGRAPGMGGGYRTTPTVGGCDGCDMCTGLICADCCCECMGGDLISCC